MPFTFSHPAIVIPLVRLFKRKISVTGLVIGSTVPDLEYFVRMRGFSRYGHSLTGVFWFDLPLGLLIAFLFHCFLRNALILQLPLYAQKRLQPHFTFDWNRWFSQHAFIVVASFLIGSLSHLLWDWLTHTGARFLEGFFERYTPISDDDDFFIYYLFFGLNSLAGLIILRRYFRQLPSYPVTSQRRTGSAFWAICVTIAIVIFLLRILSAGRLPLLSYVDSAISAFLLSVLLTVFVQKLVPL